MNGETAGDDLVELQEFIARCNLATHVALTRGNLAAARVFQRKASQAYKIIEMIRGNGDE